MSLSQLLVQALRGGAEELRLSPGRPVLWLRDGEESSQVGGPQSVDGIDELVEPLLTQDARMDLALGSAEWGVEVDGLGVVLVRAELRGGLTHVAFSLDGLVEGAALAGESDPESADELEELEELEEAVPFAGIELEPLSPRRAAAPGPAPATAPRRAPPLATSGRSVSLPPVLGGGPAGASLPPVLGGGPAGASLPPVLGGAPAGASLPSVLGGGESARPVLTAAQTQALAQSRVTTGQKLVEAPRVATPEQPSIDPVRPPPPAVTPALAPGREILQLLVATLQARGSDLHLSAGVLPMVRIDGDMRPMTAHGLLSAQMIEHLVWPVVPELARAEFRRRRDADFAVEVEGIGRFRGNLFIDRNGIGAVFRVIPTQIVPAERLGLPPEVLRLCHLPKGLVLVTGPTGSGKSTTLASLIDYVNRSRNAHIITIEDPIEFVFENKKCLVNQREVGTHTDSFRDALRAALREDPDVLLVGELRDLETIEIAIETAETGHLVFATLHTSSASQAIDRIIDQFPADRQNQIRTMLAGSIKGVIAQMLCRRNGGGRVAAFEVLFAVPAVAHLIREKKVFQIPSVMQTGAKLGMRGMNDSLADLVRRGLVTPDEALSKTLDRAGLLANLRDPKADA